MIDDLCLDTSFRNPVVLQRCHSQGGSQRWYFDKKVPFYTDILLLLVLVLLLLLRATSTITASTFDFYVQYYILHFARASILQLHKYNSVN